MFEISLEKTSAVDTRLNGFTKKETYTPQNRNKSQKNNSSNDFSLILYLLQGHCDVGKQFCCYGKSGPAPSKPIHSASNGVLIGPGGPFDKPDTGNGILVGPGGPTGIIGRPPTSNGSEYRLDKI